MTQVTHPATIDLLERYEAIYAGMVNGLISTAEGTAKLREINSALEQAGDDGVYVKKAGHWYKQD